MIPGTTSVRQFTLTQGVEKLELFALLWLPREPQHEDLKRVSKLLEWQHHWFLE